MCFSRFGASGFLNLVLGFSWRHCNGGFLGGVAGFIIIFFFGFLGCVALFLMGFW